MGLESSCGDPNGFLRLEEIEVEVVELRRWVSEDFDEDRDVKLRFLKELLLDRNLRMIEKHYKIQEEFCVFRIKSF